MTLTTRPRSEVGGLSAIVAGQGRPVVLLHGVGLRADAWGAQIAALQGDLRVVAPDMPGHGESPLSNGAMVFADYVQALRSVLDDLSEPAVLVGHSMGAQIAVELAATAPECVSAVAALNAVFERSPDAAKAVQARAAQLTAEPDPAPTLNRWFGAAASPDRAACEAWLRAMNPDAYKQAYTAFAHANGPSRDALAGLQCPALFATGAEEQNSTPAMSQQMGALAPQGYALIIAGAAHMMPMTHSAEVNAALLSLINQTNPPPVERT